jgi:nucleoside-diphosphate kinase
MTDNVETTLLLIKPNAVRSRNIGAIIDHIEKEQFWIVAMKLFQMDTTLAEKFYAIHKDKPFYSDLIAFMSSGDIIALILKKENAVSELRRVVGNTDPQKANPGTIRRLYGESVNRNSVHASDSVVNAQIEINLIFPELKLF